MGGGVGYLMLGDYKIKIRTFGWLVITYSTRNTNTAVSIVSAHADRSSLQVILAGWQWYASQHIFFSFFGGGGGGVIFLKFIVVGHLEAACLALLLSRIMEGKKYIYIRQINSKVDSL